MSTYIGTPPATPSMTLIGKATLGAPATEIVVSGIAAGYRRFVVIAALFFTAGTSALIELRINAAVTNYFAQTSAATTTMSSTDRTTAITVMPSSTGATRGMVNLDIIAPASAAKMVTGTGWADDGAAGNYNIIPAGVYTATADVNAIGIYMGAGVDTTLTTASVLYVYGSAE